MSRERLRELEDLRRPLTLEEQVERTRLRSEIAEEAPERYSGGGPGPVLTEDWLHGRTVPWGTKQTSTGKRKRKRKRGHTGRGGKAS